MGQELLKRREIVLGASMPIFYEEPIHLVRGEGVWLYDVDGRRYLDAYNNVPVVGHCHPKVVAALTEQASQLNTHTRYLHETIVAYGERLLGTFDTDQQDYRVSFVCTGSEANELALRMVRSFTGKEGIICSDQTYHGNTESVYEFAKKWSENGERSERVRAVPYPQRFRPLAGVDDEDLAEAYVALVKQAIAELQASEVGFAGLLMCPILANEGLPNVPAGYWAGVEQAVREAGGMIIFDEVQSGFGRTGEMWGHKKTGIVPDVVTMGKPMGNGHPLAAAVVRADVFDRFQRDVRYFNTFGGNPVSCAVGMAVLDVLEGDGVMENAAVTGLYLAEKLRGLQERFPLVGDLRNRGLFFALDLVTDKEKTAATAQANTIVNGMKEDGVLVSMVGRNRSVLKIRPPLVFGQSEADLLLSVLEKNLEKIG